MILRDYQQRALDQLFTWWQARHGSGEAPILVLPTGAGKSLVCAELTRHLFDTWPDQHPRTLVIVPSKELAEQNGEKLANVLPQHLRLGYYSAALGRKDPHADVIVATIGSIYKDAYRLGNIRCVIIDECHLVSPKGKEAGMYRQLLAGLAKYCQFRVVGMTATPFRGNGIWLTDGDDPLFTGIAANITLTELLDAGYLAPLVRPADVATRIDTSNIKTTSGDYNLKDLAKRVDGYIPAVADEAVQLAASRNKWIGFTATVENARHLADELNERGIHTAVVTGDTPKLERERIIAGFRAGNLRCLVTVLALATGFDVPDVDCIIWCRPTISPVLYVQGAGRGLRIAPGKTDCLWLDFSDTTERLGPLDAIRGRKRRPGAGATEAPFAICDNCGECVRPASALICPTCGHEMRREEEEQVRSASNAAILTHHLAQQIKRYDIARVAYGIHQKANAPDSLRVEYYAGLGKPVACEWVCFDHQGFARDRAERWWRKRDGDGFAPSTIAALRIAQDGGLKEPTSIVVNETGKYPEIVGFNFTTSENSHAA